MHDGNTKTLTRDDLFLSEPWPRRGQDWRKKTHGQYDAGGKARALKEGGGSAGSKTETKTVIYALKNPAGEIFYVGLTKRISERLSHHRAKYGKSIQLEVLEEVADSEHPHSAELRWMEYFLRKGCALVNKQCMWLKLHLDEPVKR